MKMYVMYIKSVRQCKTALSQNMSFSYAASVNMWDDEGNALKDFCFIFTCLFVFIFSQIIWCKSFLKHNCKLPLTVVYISMGQNVIKTLVCALCSFTKRLLHNNPIINYIKMGKHVR